MKNYSTVLSWQSLENIDLLKLASEASQENFEKNVFLTPKYEQIVRLEHLFCPKVGGHKHTCAPPPLLKVGGARAPPPCPPFSYALAYVPIEGFLKQAILAAGGDGGGVVRATSNRQDRYLHHVKMCVCGDGGRRGGGFLRLIIHNLLCESQ